LHGIIYTRVIKTQNYESAIEISLGIELKVIFVPFILVLQ